MKRWIVIAALTFASPAYADPPPKTPMTFSVKGDVMYAVGEIQRDSVNEFDRMFTFYPGVRVIDFHSRGGSTLGGMEIGRSIAKRGLTTRVTGSCYSACSLAFFGGKERETTFNGTVAVHQGRFPQGTRVSFADMQTAIAMDIDYILDMGIDPRVISLGLRTPSDTIAFMTMKEKLALKVITREYDPRKPRPDVLSSQKRQSP